MVSLHRPFLRQGRWLTLALGTALVTAGSLSADPLRGPPISLRPSTYILFAPPGAGPQPFGPAFGPQGTQAFAGGLVGNQIGPYGAIAQSPFAGRYTAQLMPGKPLIPLLNNGSLHVQQNPAPAGTPNINPYTYIAGLPLGDRLGVNGVFYDPELVPNYGFTPSSLMTPNQSFVPPYSYGAILGQSFQRQRMMAMYSAYAAYNQMAMTGYGQQVPAFAPQPFGGNVYGYAQPALVAANAPAAMNPNAFAGFNNAATDKKKDDKKKDDKKKDDKDEKDEKAMN